MSARPISSAIISFGLVSVPVKLYSSAETSKKISFNLVSKKHGTRLKQQYITPETGDIVPREEMVKGYEFTKGKYVLFTPEELKTIEEKATHSIDITEFVPFEQVDRGYLDKVYYLGPDKGGDRAYKLLSAALRETGQSAVAKYAARGKQYRVSGPALRRDIFPARTYPISRVRSPESPIRVRSPSPRPRRAEPRRMT